MPKYCSVPNCKNDSASDSDRKSFYRFPLQDPVRLQQWLKNMGRENWIPSRHQYICHEHFAPSCFKVRWGIRYLERDAVPTVFQEAEKRKATDNGEKKPKRLRTSCNPSVSVSDDKTMVFDAADMQNTVHTVHLYQIAVDPSQQEETSLVQLSDVGESDCSFEPELDSLATVDRLETGVNFPLTVLHTIDHLSNSGEKTEVVVMSQCPAGEGQDELMNEITAAILTQGRRLVVNDSTLECTDEAVALSGVEDVTHTTELFSDGDDDNHETQVIAYFETIPNVLPKDTITQFTFSPETVLSSALSSTPITSTLPIVSKHAVPSPTSLVLTMERLDSEGGEGDEGKSEDDDTEQDYQLEEHCYHKNSLSKEQLEGIVCELQKKVKVLQQRHRRHLEKLVGLENTVSQLRQSNLLNEERLQLLERAYIQTNGAVSDAGETVTIIYEEDDAAYLYTPLIDTEAKL